MLRCLLVLCQLPLLLESGVADVTRVRSETCVDSKVVFDIAVLVKSIIAVCAEVHGIVPLRGNIVNLFGEVDALFTTHVRDRISFRMGLVKRLSCAVTLNIDRIFWKGIRFQDI